MEFLRLAIHSHSVIALLGANVRIVSAPLGLGHPWVVLGGYVYWVHGTMWAHALGACGIGSVGVHNPKIKWRGHLEQLASPMLSAARYREWHMPFGPS